MGNDSKSIVIDGYTINKGQRPYIIAELSGNHNGDIERAFAIMKEAKKAGADAVKIQTFTADTITLDHDSSDFIVDLPLWKNRTLYDLYQEAHTPWDWHEAIFDKGREIGITVFSSPFDPTAVDFLESLNVPAYKIASPELVDIPLIQKVAATGKPMIMSTGMATLEEIDDAVKAARSSGCKELILLHCISAYPTPYEEANLANIQELAKCFDVYTGLSDHSMGTIVPVAATALGAVVIEKHFTDSRAKGGVDSAFSLEPEELEKLVKDVAICADACGGPVFGPKASEMKNINYRRSLYAVQNIKKGEKFTTDNVRSIRPAFGLKPKHLQQVLSGVSEDDIKKGEPLTWAMIKK